MIAGEYLAGFAILLVTLLCILVPAVVSLAELPKDLRHNQEQTSCGLRCTSFRSR